MISDRTVHARTGSGCEIVRYDRAGKWYAETASNRHAIPLSEAVYLAGLRASQVFLGRPGGRLFDARVGRILMERIAASSREQKP